MSLFRTKPVDKIIAESGTFGFLSSVYLMAALPFDTWMRLLAWMALGVLIYFICGKQHSHLNKSADAEKGNST
ncbi:MAG: hypothetical protein HKN25_02040 [Pyrinomonadaceae bacterium]|nr:hypothetical protein [Pyrinomonadaceae bacterium]